MKTSYLQRGGTLIGFIAGLVAGLIIAVIVAMVVTKTALPFSNKQSKQGKIAEATSATTVDPNRLLYGSASAAKDPAKSGTPATSGTESDDAPKKNNLIGHEKKADTQDVIGEKIKAHAAATTPAAKKDKPVADDKWSYFLQTNAYRDPAEAQNERARLALAGFESRVSQTSINGAALYRVRLGPFPNMDAVNNMRHKLSDNGINAAVVRIPK